jgi:DNA (cytosine-5)-methyltransferase 1
MGGLTFGSVCSGIEAASVAWEPLGWRAAFLSEIAPAPRAVLTQHFPHVPLRGDFTEIQRVDHDPIGLLVGGTPCQSFSVAGLRRGMADERGNLALEYLRLADRLRPRWLVWENVPGVLSSNGGRDFGSFLGGMVQLGYGLAYRVLDAQFFGLAQRRKRVFVVGYLGDWRRAAAVLFEPASLRGDPAPRREAGKGVAAGTLRSSDGGSDVDHARALHLVAGTLCNNGKASGSATQQDADQGLLIAHTLRGEGFDASEDGTGRGTPLVPVPFDTTQITSASNYSNPQPGDPCHPLAAGAHPPAVCFDWQKGNDRTNCRPSTMNVSVEQSHTLSSTRVPAVAAGAHPPTMAFQSSQSGVRIGEAHATLDANNGARRHNGVMAGAAVRRLTPRECERLQGFPDDWTLVPYRGKPMADGPRYQALGNSMAVSVMAKIGQRIETQHAAITGEGA